MNEPLSERTETLLGRSLLGTADEAELRELEELRRESSPLREAMDLLEGTSGEFRRAAPGEEIEMTEADLPDYLRPRELSRGLSRWFRVWALFGAAAAAGLLGVIFAATLKLSPGTDQGRLAVRFLVPGAAAVAIVLVAGYLARDRVMARMLEGGADWRRAVEAVRRQEAFFFSPAASTVVRFLALATAILMTGGTLVHGPAGGALLLVAAITLAATLVIVKRRLLLGRLRGPSGAA